jgi:glutaredoxin
MAKWSPHIRKSTVRSQAVLAALIALGAAATVTMFERIAAAEQSAMARTERCLHLQLYIRSDSPLCLEAQRYAESFRERRGGICIEVIDTITDKNGLNRYWQLMRRFRVEKPRVPTFHACDRLKIGFSDPAKSAAAIEDLFAIHTYIRPTCPHCRDAKQFLTGLAKRWKGVRIVFHDMDHEPGAVREMTALAQKHGITVPSFPIIYVCNRVISGYHTDATTGRQIEELLIKASEEVIKRATAQPTAAQRKNSGAQAHLLVPTGNPWTGSRFGVAAVASVGDWNVAENGAPLSKAEATDAPGLQPSLPPLEAEADATEQSYVAPVEPPEGIHLPWFGYVRVRDWGLPAFTLLIGLIDGFNPCAMWVLVFLLSVLVNIKDRRKIAAIAGTFVVVSGLAYFAFMAAWLNLFVLVGIARPLQVTLGILALVIGIVNVKDFFAFKRGVTLSIPESAKPGIYARLRRMVTTEYISVAMGLSVMLAIVVNVIELMCTAGLPAIYTQILTLQQLVAWKNYAYLGLYILGYMFDDTIMVMAFIITLSHRKLREGEGRWLKLVSGVVVLALGLAMLFRPDLLQWK